MKPFQLSLLLFIFIGFTSCEKEDSGTDTRTESLQQLSNGMTITCDYTGMNRVHWKMSMNSGIISYHPDDFLKIEWKEKNTSESWKNKTFAMGTSVAAIDGLKAHTEYQFRFSFCNEVGGSVQNSVLDYTTRSFDFNYEKMYPTSFRLEQSIFSLEDGLHTLYGYGFTNAPLTFHFAQESDASVSFNVTATVLNDSTLTVKIPADVIPNNPYEVCRFYKVTVNGFSIMNQNDYYTKKINGITYGNITYAASFDVFNKDFVFNKVDIEYTRAKYDPFDTYSFVGYMGLPNDRSSQKNEYYLGVPMAPEKRILYVRSGTATATMIDVSESASMRDLWWSRISDDKVYREDGFPYVQGSAGYRLKLNLSPGNYTVQLVTKTSNGAVTKSTNEYPFTVTAQ